MKLYWMRTSEAWPDDSWLPTSFTLFDEHKPHRQGDSLWDTYVAGVHQIDAGPQAGMWTWSVTATFPGPRCPYASNGVEATRKEAARKAVETYRQMVEFYAVHTPPQWRDKYQAAMRRLDGAIEAAARHMKIEHDPHDYDDATVERPSPQAARETE